MDLVCKSLFQSGAPSNGGNTVLKCADGELRTHSFVLKRFSRVFKEAYGFKARVEGKVNGVYSIDVTGCHVGVIRYILCCLYDSGFGTGTIDRVYSEGTLDLPVFRDTFTDFSLILEGFRFVGGYSIIGHAAALLIEGTKRGLTIQNWATWLMAVPPESTYDTLRKLILDYVSGTLLQTTDLRSGDPFKGIPPDHPYHSLVVDQYRRAIMDLRDRRSRY